MSEPLRYNDEGKARLMKRVDEMLQPGGSHEDALIRDRLTLAFLAETAPGEWKIAPPCFTPNARCLDQEKRGLIEIGQDRRADAASADGCGPGAVRMIGPAVAVALVILAAVLVACAALLKAHPPRRP